MRRAYLLVASLLMSFLVRCAYADRGMLPVSAGATVYEPGQKAILAWNGHEEIMILSTDVSSSQETLVLEILPLPSEPEIEAADFQSFKEIQYMVWEAGVNLLHYQSIGEARQGGIDIVLHTQIGPHNITVVKSDDTAGLAEWIEDFLEANGVAEQVSLHDFEPIIQDYMNRGFHYYVLDLITISTGEKTVDPILYRFDSSFLYYPLVISSRTQGNTMILLFLISEGKMNKDCSPLQPVHFKVSGKDVEAIELLLSKPDLARIDSRFEEFFPHEAWLTFLEYYGPLGALNEDLVVTGGDFYPPAAMNVEVALLLSIVVLSVFGVHALTGAISSLVIHHPKGIRKQLTR